MFGTLHQLTSMLDATLLRPDTSEDQVRALSRMARDSACAAVCVAPGRLQAASLELAGGSTRLAAAVSFPYGSATLAGKIREAGEALALGADELDVVLDLDAVRRGDVEDLEREMHAIMAGTPTAVHKLIVELGWLPAPAWAALGSALRRLRPAFVKTGTGVNAGSATVAQVRRLVEVSKGEIPIKAAGGIRSLEAAAALAAAGAARLGTSAAEALVRAWHEVS